MKKRATEQLPVLLRAISRARKSDDKNFHLWMAVEGMLLEMEDQIDRLERKQAFCETSHKGNPKYHLKYNDESLIYGMSFREIAEIRKLALSSGHSIKDLVSQYHLWCDVAAKAAGERAGITVAVSHIEPFRLWPEGGEDDGSTDDADAVR